MARGGLNAVASARFGGRGGLKTRVPLEGHEHGSFLKRQSAEVAQSLFVVIAWRSVVVDGCVLICLLCRVFFKVRANRRVGKSKDPKTGSPKLLSRTS